MIRKVRYILEAVIVFAFYYCMRLLPIEIASNIGSSMVKVLGPRLKIDKLARKNIKNALPELSDQQVEKVVEDMWDNLGRVFGEFPRMSTLRGKEFYDIVEVEGEEYIDAAAQSEKSTFFVSAHFANWELGPQLISEKKFSDVSFVYRKSNNPYIDRLIINSRKHYGMHAIPKGASGVRDIIAAVKRGGTVLMLVDQKQNDGIAVPFFHKEAMTAPAIATLKLKYDCVIHPVQVVRLGGTKFKIKICSSIEIEKTGDNTKDTLAIMTRVNAAIEGFIRENPGQWFWVHNRWPK